MDAQSGPQRTRRVTRACDRCHSTNTKCAPGLEPTVCRTCFEFRSPCTYQRPVQRRGPKPSSEPPAASRVDVVHSSAMSATTPTGWKYSPLVDHDMILGLVEGFHSIAYPIFPLFHWPSFATKVRQRHYTTDQPLYATVMAVCAIVVGRQRHTTDSQFPHFQVPSPQTQKPPSKAFYRAAIAAFPTDLSRAQGFEYKRAKVLMAIASIQYGAILEHQTHLGEYVVLACNDGYHDESRWERSLNEIERQERRRLFWSAYTLEVFSAITWDGIVRFRERQSNVCYPAEVYDEDITEHGCNYLANPSFIKGWNFTTDLYRVLEHLVGRLRNRRREPDRISAMFPTAEPSGSDVIAHLEAMQASLPVIYRSAQVMTGDDKQDSFGFQAANIAITFQTVKLALAGAENHSVGKNCEIAGELLDVLAGIPTSYIMAISTPMLHHLASCGHILANIIQSPLSPWALIQVRNVLTAMIDLLSGLERSLSLASDVSVKLRGHVAQIETYMEQAAKTAQQGQVFHGVIPQYIHNTSMAVTAGIDDAHPASGALKNEIMPSNATDTFADDLDSWGNDFTFEWPPDHQIALQTDLTENWPFDFGGGMYDFLGQGNANVQGSSDQGFLDPLGDGANGSQGFTNMQDQREHSGTYEG